VDALAGIVQTGGPAIASVTLHFPTDGSQGGHLVLVTGVTYIGGTVVDVHFNDPSRWGAVNNVVPADRFAASFTGRIVRTLTPAATGIRASA
jgi:hypothetical protein